MRFPLVLILFLQYIILNLGISPSFQQQDYMHLEFPSKMYVDYVRVYQRAGTKNGITCNPPNRPTAKYINESVAQSLIASGTDNFLVTSMRI